MVGFGIEEGKIAAGSGGSVGREIWEGGGVFAGRFPVTALQASPIKNMAMPKINKGVIRRFSTRVSFELSSFSGATEISQFRDEFENSLADSSSLWIAEKNQIVKQFGPGG